MNDPFKSFKPLSSHSPASKPSASRRGDGFVESMRDIGASALGSLKNDVVKGTAKSIFDQLLGSSQSGNTPKGEEPNFYEEWIKDREEKAASSARTEERQKFAAQKSQEKVLFSLADEGLRKEIDSVREELAMLVKSMGKVEQQIEKAVMDNVVDAGVYHLNFFRNLQGWLRMMRKSLEDASLWLEMSSGRGKRSHYWKQFGKSGTKYSLSSERTLATQAG